MRQNYIYFILLISLLFAGQKGFSQCNFSISNSNPCGKEAVTFTVSNPSGTYGWDFDGDGNIDSYGSSVTYTFPQTGVDQSYVINLYRNNVFCSSEQIIVNASPNPILGVVPGNAIIEEDLIRLCSSTPEATLQIINLSTTLNIDELYLIDWGDGSLDTFDINEFGPTGFVEHDYLNYGYYNLTFTATANNGCTNAKSYTFYNGSNPSVGLANPGNTVGLCAPATIEFPITNYQNNPVGTEYHVYISGELIQTFTQANVPGSFTYTFLETSCGLSTSTGNYNNAFDVQVEAVNPCGSSQATIEPIEVSTPPELDFEADVPNVGCQGEPINIADASSNVNEVISGNPSTCESSLTPSWTISPGISGIDWTIVSGNTFGSDEISIIFNIPGVYTITMSINSPSCGPATYSETFTILELPDAGATFELNNSVNPNVADQCTPTVGTFNNQSTGDSLEFTWLVSPPSGWEFADGFSATDLDVEINFNQAGTYTVGLITENSCANANWDTTFVIADVPVVSINNLSPFCEEGILNIDQSDVNYNSNGGVISSYSWEFPGANPNTSSDAYPTGIYYDSPGTYTISLTVENQCGTTTTTGILEIQQPGNLVIDNDYIVCQEDDPFTLFAIPTGGTWSGNGVSLDGLFTPGSSNIGQNTLIYTIGDGACSLTDSLQVTVLATPQVEAGDGQEACEDEDPFLITGASPPGGIWSSNNGGVIIGGDAFDPLASGTGVYTITYTYVDINGCSNEDSKTIIILENPQVDAGPDLSICENPNDIQLNGFSPSGGSWTGTGVNSAGIFNVQNTPGQGDYTLYYSFVNPNTGCSALDSLLISVVSNDTADAGGNLEFCLNDDEFILADGFPAGGVWSGPGVDINGIFFNPSIAGAGIHVLTYTYGDGYCQTEDTKVVIVHNPPTLAVPPNMAVCRNNGLIDLSIASPAGGIWSGQGIVNTDFDPQIAGVGIHTLLYQYTNPNTGCSNQKEMEIEVFPIPVIGVGDSTYCDQPGIVELPAASPQNGTWQGPALVGNNSFDIGQIGGVGSYPFVYSFTNSFGCLNSDTANIEIIAPALIDPGPNDSLCIDQGLLTLENFTPIGGFWSGPGIIDSILGIFDPSVAGGGSHSIKYTYGSENCQVDENKIIFVIDLTGVGIGDSESFCEFDENIQLYASGPQGGIWSGPGIINTNLGIFDPSAAGPGVHTISYQYNDPLIGCSASDEKEITIYEQLPANFEMSGVSCKNKTVLFQNLSGPDDFSFWDLGDGSTTIARNPIHIYDSVATYLIRLITTNESGCQDTIEQNILVTEEPDPNYELNTNFGCGPLDVNFSNQSTGYDVNFIWDFGNGTTSTALNPEVQTYEAGLNDTIYFVTLVASNLCGSVTLEDSVIVRPLPNAEFAFYPEEPCSPMTVNFGNASSGSVENFYWDFGNGNFSTDTLPSPQVYVTDTTVANFDILLIASNICGVDTAMHSIQVEPADVRAFFTVSDNRGCQPFTVDFTNYATPGANVDWVFGDGNSSIELNPVHTFNDPGTYKVIQYATSDCGYDTTAIDIVVLPSPLVEFDHLSYVCLGTSITFLNTSEGTSGSEWNFGDGTGSTLTSPTHVYDSAGTFTVHLTGYSQFNQCPAEYSSEIIVQGLPLASFEPMDQFGCAPFNASFDNSSVNSEFFVWDFGDGNTSVDPQPNHYYEDVGTYEVTLIATDAYGCSNDTSVLNIMVHPSPVAEFSFDQESQCTLPANFLFENTSTDAAGFIWDFGDGTGSSGNNPAHTYFEEGSYDITLIASNQFNCIDTSIQSVQVMAQPQADFDAENFLGCSPVTVTFSNASTFGNNFYWTFGDGQTSTEENPELTFVAEGFHGAQLVVSNNDICFDTVSVTSLVQVYPPVVASFSANAADEGIQSGRYEMINSSIGADTYFWDFSDGTTSDEISPTHSFSSNGVFQVYLEVSNQFGCVDDTLISFTPDYIKGLHIPNGFSPEQGIGDVRLFKPAGTGLSEYKIQVFSPYGQLLWESNKLNEKGEPVEAWDGTFEGKLLPQDVYVWKAWGMFGDGTVWPGERKEKGGYHTLGSVILLR